MDTIPERRTYDKPATDDDRATAARLLARFPRWPAGTRNQLERVFSLVAPSSLALSATCKSRSWSVTTCWTDWPTCCDGGSIKLIPGLGVPDRSKTRHCEPLGEAIYVWTAPWLQGFWCRFLDRIACVHVSGLFVRAVTPLAKMVSATWVPNRVAASSATGLHGVSLVSDRTDRTICSFSCKPGIDRRKGGLLSCRPISFRPRRLAAVRVPRHTPRRLSAASRQHAPSCWPRPPRQALVPCARAAS